MQQQKMKRITLCLAFFVIFLLGIIINGNNAQAATEGKFIENGIVYWDYGDGRVFDVKQGIVYRYKSSSKTYTAEKYVGMIARPQIGMDHVEYKALREDFDGNIVIPDTIKGKKVTALEDKIFRWSSQIFSITIGKNIKSIGTEAFDECTKLKTVNMEKASLTSLPKGCFFCCTALKEVVLPTKLTSLPEGCFSNCKALEEFVLPASITKLGEGAFSGCTKLEKVTIKGM